MTILHARSSGRLLLVLACLAALLMAPAPPAQAAQTINERVPFTASGVFCTGEPIVVEGTLHIVGTRTEDESGGGHLTYHQDLRAQGVSPSGDKYIFTEADNSRSKVDAESADNLTSTQNLHVIRQGEDGTTEVDYKAQVTLHFTQNANGVLTAEVSNAEFTDLSIDI